MDKPAVARVQWKGTDVCLTFECICGYVGHFDGEFCYGLQCARCGKLWEMPTELVLKDGPIDVDDSMIKGTLDGHDERRAIEATAFYPKVSDEVAWSQ